MDSLQETLDTVPEGKAPARRRSRGTRLPEDWKRSAADVAWQKHEGIPDAFARQATENFKDFFLTSTSPRAWKLNWSQAWKVWMRTEWYSRCTERRRQEWLAIQAERDAQATGRQRGHVPEALAR